jgi:hypothetical protein
MVMLHNAIMSPPPGMLVDHIDGDGLNNCRSNLRICTHRQNIWNSRKFAVTLSPFKGVHYDHGAQRWRASIRAECEHIHLGSFEFEFDAAKQYDRAARLMFGKFAKTNEMLGLYEGAQNRGALDYKRIGNRRWRQEMGKLGISPRVA